MFRMLRAMGRRGYLLAIDGATKQRIDRVASGCAREALRSDRRAHQAAVCLRDCVVCELGVLGDQQDTLVRGGVLAELRATVMVKHPR